MDPVDKENALTNEQIQSVLISSTRDVPTCLPAQGGCDSNVKQAEIPISSSSLYPFPGQTVADNSEENGNVTTIVQEAGLSKDDKQFFFSSGLSYPFSVDDFDTFDKSALVTEEYEIDEDIANIIGDRDVMEGEKYQSNLMSPAQGDVAIGSSSEGSSDVKIDRIQIPSVNSSFNHIYGKSLANISEEAVHTITTASEENGPSEDHTQLPNSGSLSIPISSDAFGGNESSEETEFITEEFEIDEDVESDENKEAAQANAPSQTKVMAPMHSIVSSSFLSLRDSETIANPIEKIAANPSSSQFPGKSIVSNSIENPQTITTVPEDLDAAKDVDQIHESEDLSNQFSVDTLLDFDAFEGSTLISEKYEFDNEGKEEALASEQNYSKFIPVLPEPCDVAAISTHSGGENKVNQLTTMNNSSNSSSTENLADNSKENVDMIETFPEDVRPVDADEDVNHINESDSPSKPFLGYDGTGDKGALEEGQLLTEEYVDGEVDGGLHESKDELLQQTPGPSLKSDDGEVLKPLRYYTKRVLKYQTPQSALEPLPDGWITVSHTSGFPVYLHRSTKVVTWSRPYVVDIAKGGVKKHLPQLNSIPCLDYLKTLEKLQVKKDEPSEAVKTVDATDGHSSVVNGGSSSPEKKNQESSTVSNKVAPTAILHTGRSETISEVEFVNYLQKRFMFDTSVMPHFEKWSEKRRFHKQMQKNESALEAQQNTAAGAAKLAPAKLITLCVPNDGSRDRSQKVVFNTSIKPMLCVLHEYVQTVLKTRPTYIFNTREDSSEPFEATISIGDKIYATASGINKKSAKNKAALATMEMLVPGFKEQVDNVSAHSSTEYFDSISVTDPRVYELCMHAGNFLPYQLLTECLKRNLGVADTSVSFNVKIGKAKTVEYSMECGKHKITGTAKNKKTGKQLAAQQILKLLHPTVKTWGELIRMYGTSVVEKRTRRKNIEQQILELKQRKATPVTSLDSEARTSEDKVSVEDNEIDDVADSSSRAKVVRNKNEIIPNPELLNKLKDMMVELAQESKATKNDKKKTEEKRKIKEEKKNEDEPEMKKSRLLMINY